MHASLDGGCQLASPQASALAQRTRDTSSIQLLVPCPVQAMFHTSCPDLAGRHCLSQRSTPIAFISHDESPKANVRPRRAGNTPSGNFVRDCHPQALCPRSFVPAVSLKGRQGPGTNLWRYGREPRKPWREPMPLRTLRCQAAPATPSKVSRFLGKPFYDRPWLENSQQAGRPHGALACELNVLPVLLRSRPLADPKCREDAPRMRAC